MLNTNYKPQNEENKMLKSINNPANNKNNNNDTPTEWVNLTDEWTEFTFNCQDNPIVKETEWQGKPRTKFYFKDSKNKNRMLGLTAYQFKILQGFLTDDDDDNSELKLELKLGIDGETKKPILKIKR